MTTDAPNPVPQWSSTPPRLLVIDDNPSIHRDFDLVLLEDPGDPGLESDEALVYGHKAQAPPRRQVYLVDHALSGQAGVEKVQAALAEDRPYQVAFVDIRMPGMDGVETIERLWGLDSRIQMVICTAYADYSQDDLARRLGFTDKLLVLKKPFDSIEVTQLAITLTEKWYLGRQVALRLEQMELLVAQRTKKLLELQRSPPVAGQGQGLPATGPAEPERELPLLLLAGLNASLGTQLRTALGLQFGFLDAADAETALSLARDQVPDLIVAEHQLAGASGTEFCRRAKQEELTSHIPVVLVASTSSERLQLDALLAGADSFVAAPFDVKALETRLQTLLRARAGTPAPASRDLSTSPRELAENQLDVQFLRRTIDTVEKHMSDFEFDVEGLAQKMFMSRRQLFRKLKSVAGCAPNVLIRNLRLKRAGQLLKESSMTVTEITYAVGFADLKHFRTIFREHFGVLPGEFAERQG
jgi:CheY-like chemotaxis protein/AraC-like DNA-binding protein